MPDGVVQVLHPDPQLFSHRSERFVPIRRVLDVPDSLISKVQKTNKRCHGPSPLLSDTVLAVADRACWKKTAIPPELRMPQRLQDSDCRVTTDYMEMFPYNLPDNHPVDVKITSCDSCLGGNFSASSPTYG